MSFFLKDKGKEIDPASVATLMTEGMDPSYREGLKTSDFRLARSFSVQTPDGTFRQKLLAIPGTRGKRQRSEVASGGERLTSKTNGVH